MFEQIECPRAWEWEDLGSDAAADYRSHVLDCPTCAAEASRQRLLSGLLHEGDPAAPLSAARSLGMKRDLLARCAEPEPELAAPPVTRMRHGWLWWPAALVGAVTVGAVVAGVALSSLMRPAGELSVIRATPPDAPIRKAAGGAPTQPLALPQNAARTFRPRRSLPSGKPDAPAPPVFAAAARQPEPALPPGQRVKRTAVASLPAVDETHPARSNLAGAPVERLVLDIGPREVVSGVASVALVVNGSPSGGEASVGVVYTHLEEKTP